MTISSTTRIAGPYTGSGTTGPFTFAFKVFQASDLVVVKREISTATDTVLTLTTDYSVTLNGNQNSSPGGSVTLVSSISSSYELTLTSDIENKQPTDLTNQGGFYPEVITDALDRACIQIQQLASLNTRSLVAPISDGLSTSLALPAADLRANKYLAFDANGVPMAADGTDTPNITSAGNMTITANNAGSNVARDVIFYDNATETMRIDRTTIPGTTKVGIGTSTPASRLHIHESGATNCNVSLTNGTSGSTATDGLLLRMDTVGQAFVYNMENAPLLFGTNATEKMQISAGGRVGIGTSNPSAVLDLGAQGLGRGITWTATGATEPNNNIFSSWGGVGLVFAAGVAPSTVTDSYLSPNSASIGRSMIRMDAFGSNAGTMQFYTNAASIITAGNAVTPTERMRIDPNGKVGIGVAPSTQLHVKGQASAPFLRLETTDAISSGGVCYLDLYGSAGRGGYVGFGGVSNTLDIWNDAAGTTRFGTNNTERMRILSAGQLCINSTTVLSTTNRVNVVYPGAGAEYGMGFRPVTATTTTATTAITFEQSNGTSLGSISHPTTGGTVYNTTSDYRLKTNVTLISNALDRIDALKPCNYTWIDSGVSSEGFIAHELQEVIPQAVTGTKDEVDDQGNIRAQGVDHSRVVPTLTAAIKDLKAIVEAQAARIAALEANA